MDLDICIRPGKSQEFRPEQTASASEEEELVNVVDAVSRSSDVACKDGIFVYTSSYPGLASANIQKFSIVESVLIAVVDACRLGDGGLQHESVDGQANFRRQVGEGQHCCDMDEFGSKREGLEDFCACGEEI